MTGCAKTMSDCPGRVEIWQIFSTCKTTGQRKNLLEKAAFWQEVNVVCCLHAKLITFQCTHVTDDDLADRLIGNYKTRRRNVAVPNVCLQTPHPFPWKFPLLAIFSLFPQTESPFKGYAKTIYQSLSWSRMRWRRTLSTGLNACA